MTGTFNSLPAELLCIIGKNVAGSDLASLVATDKRLNATLTPILYGAISLSHPERLIQCLTTLSPLRLGTWYHDSSHLASLVRSFFLHIPAQEKAKSSQVFALDGLNTHFYYALSRMSGLRSATIHHPSLFTPAICLGVFRGAASSLQHLDLQITLGNQQMPTLIAGLDLEAEFGAYNPTCPNLSSVKIYCKGSDTLPEELGSFFHRLFASHELQMRSLALRMDDTMAIAPLLHESITWPVLQHLEINASCLCMIKRNLMLRVRSLRVYTSNTPENRLSPADHGVLPMLEELHCSAKAVALLLPEPAVPPAAPTEFRRLSKVELTDPATPSANPFSAIDIGSWVVLPDVTTIATALRRLQASHAPLRTLTIAVGYYGWDDVAAGLRPYVRDVERLELWRHSARRPVRVLSTLLGRRGGLMRYDAHPQDESLLELGERLFAHMPRLHTFRISVGDVPEDGWDPRCDLFGEMYLTHWQWLQDWGARARALHTVELAAGFTWTRRGEGWGWVPDDPEVLAFLEDSLAGPAHVGFRVRRAFR
ncbi:hypothetical protein C8Q77DRAFT_1150368 [Trametes polyzona]|nr:hypothetical protein C8Q77DRAFT_1150368 [Trametes polyzona]